MTIVRADGQIQWIGILDWSWRLDDKGLVSRLDLIEYLISDIDKQDIVTFREPKRSRSGLWELFQF